MESPCTKTLCNELWRESLPITPFELPEALSRNKKKRRCYINKRIFERSVEERPEEVMGRIVCGHWESVQLEITIYVCEYSDIDRKEAPADSNEYFGQKASGGEK